MINSWFIERVERRNRSFLREVFKSIMLQLDEESRLEGKESAREKNQATTHLPVLFLSDFHLGSQTCNAKPLLEYLRSTNADMIYLVGDVFDMWVNFKRQWKPIHTEIITELVRKARAGTRVVYTPGNHDDFFRGAYCQLSENFEIAEDAIYLSPNGKRYLVVHGDIADNIPVDGEVISFLASRAEHLLRNMIKLRNFIGKLIGAHPSEIVDKLVYMFNIRYSVSARHQDMLLQLAKAQDCDGVICGHFHIPANQMTADGHYINCGDWIDHCSAAYVDARGEILVKSYAPRPFVNLKRDLIPDYDVALNFEMLLAHH